MGPRVLSVILAGAALSSAAASVQAQPVLISARPDGAPGNHGSFQPVASADGRFIAFSSMASDLVAGDGPAQDVFLRDRDTDADGVLDEAGAVATVRVSERNGIPGNGDSQDPAITPDGRYVVFASSASNLFAVNQPQLGYKLVFRWDRLTGEIVLVSQTAGGEPLNGNCWLPAVTADGNTVYFVSYATNDGTGVATSRGVVLRRNIAEVTLARVSDATLTAGAGLIVDEPTVSDDGSVVAYALGGHMAFAGDSQLAYTIGFASYPQVFVTPLAAVLDGDADGLNDHWERAFGSSITPGSGATGVDGPDGDPDGDGLTNAQELARGSHPRGTLARYLAEGATGSFFSTRYAIANPGDTDVAAAVRLETDGGGVVTRVVTLPGRSRATVESRALGLGTATFSAVVESPTPLAVDRLMTWSDRGDPPYGSHAETAGGAPTTSWFLAEGSTVLGFQLFYLLQNPQATATTATIRFLLPSAAPIVRTYDLPARSRTTVFVNTVPGLESTDVSAEITATQPIAVERAMYRNGPGRTFALGHAAAAVAAPATTWVFAEGASNDFFDTYLLLANPGSTSARVQVSYLPDTGGPVTQTYTVAAGTRHTVFVDTVAGLDTYGIRVTSDAPIVAERSMYWAGGFFDYYEGHVSAGATAAGGHWALAEGETATPGAPFQAVTFVLVANTGTDPATFRLRTLPEPGGTARDSGPATLQPGQRTTIPMSTLLASGRFGVEVIEEGTTTGALIVEGAMYWSTGEQLFAAGANWPATRIP